MKQLIKKRFAGYFCVSVLLFQLSLVGSVKADFDGDSQADIFTVNSDKNLIWREGSLQNARELVDWKSIDSAGVSVDVTVGDFDSDGFVDVMNAKNGDGYNMITWREANGIDNSLNWVTNIQSSNPYSGILMGDFDSDGNTDLFVNQGGTVRWFEYDSNAAAKYVSHGPKAWGVTGGMVVGDFDRFGGRDWLVVKDSQVAWYEATGDNAYHSVQTFNSIYVQDIALGDFDGDEEPDLLMVARQDNATIGITAGDVLMYESRIPPNVTDWRLDGRGAIDANSIDIELADIDGDGRNELISTSEDGGYRYYVASSTASGYHVTEVDGSRYDPQALSIAIAPTVFQPMPPCEPLIAASDINGDCDVNYDDLIMLAEQWLYLQ
ncbi:MAG: FG-GAP repeat domain-containing protein [Sedimentisphaeraceae bacterium JB056]